MAWFRLQIKAVFYCFAVVLNSFGGRADIVYNDSGLSVVSTEMPDDADFGF